jgi:hypothetical protein
MPEKPALTSVFSLRERKDSPMAEQLIAAARFAIRRYT